MRAIATLAPPRAKRIYGSAGNGIVAFSCLLCKATGGEGDEMDLLHFGVPIGSPADESADLSGILPVDPDRERRAAGEGLLAGCRTRFLPRHAFRLGGSICQP